MKKIRVIVKPNSKKGPLVEAGEGDSLTIYVREPAIDGKANEAVIRLVSEYFSIPKGRVSVARGHTGKFKVLEIAE